MNLTAAVREVAVISLWICFKSTEFMWNRLAVFIRGPALEYLAMEHKKIGKNLVKSVHTGEVS